MTKCLIAFALTAFALAASQPAHAQDLQQKLAAAKESAARNQQALRSYSWLEKVELSLKGEVKATKIDMCRYGADGKVQKTPVGQPPAQPQAQGSGGGRGRGRLKQQIVEKKKDEMKDYMEKAAALIHQYVPPNPEQIQAAKDAGRIAVNPQAGGKVRLVISQYLKPSDSLTVDLDPASNRLLGLGVNSYLDTKDDVVTLVVQMNTLPDGALYAEQTTLDAKAKNIQVVIQNAGHRPLP